jgi:hypothetical protein
VPEQHEQNDDRQWNSDQPQKRAFAETHDVLLNAGVQVQGAALSQVPQIEVMALRQLSKNPGLWAGVFSSHGAGL